MQVLTFDKGFSSCCVQCILIRSVYNGKQLIRMSFLYTVSSRRFKEAWGLRRYGFFPNIRDPRYIGQVTTMFRNAKDSLLTDTSHGWRLEIFVMSAWPSDCNNLNICKIILLHQYNETNVVHFSFNLLRIKSLYVFRALLAHLQEALHKCHLVYCVRMCDCSFTGIVAQPTDIIRKQDTKCRLCSTSWGWANNARSM
jgi:hypothetical protein